MLPIVVHLYPMLTVQIQASRNYIVHFPGRLLDDSRMLEFKKLFGGNLVCGWGHLSGQLTGFIANAGPITGPDAQKGEIHR